MSETVVELQAGRTARCAPPRDRRRRTGTSYRGNMAEILDGARAAARDAGHAGHPRALPARALRRDAGYDGDPKLVTTFPTESDAAGGQPFAQIVEGPIAFSALCEHHALPVPRPRARRLHRRRADHRHLEADPARPPLRAPLHRAGAARRADRRHARRSSSSPQGVAVRLEASHLCTQMRGVEEHSRTTTTAWRGVYRDAELRREFLDLAR